MTKIFTNKSNIDLDYPICRPSLDLDFTQEVLNPRITFTRGTSGTRVNRNRLIETMSINTPRFDYDPVTGESLGLLIEESRTNSLQYSQDFTQGIWGGADRLISTNVITAPDGTTTASAFIENGLSNKFHYLNQITSKSTSSIQYTASCWIKDKGRQVEIKVQSNGSNGVSFGRFNPSTGQITVSPFAFGTGWTVGSSNVVSYPNGWYRISVSGTSDTLNIVSLQITIANGSNYVYTGDGTSGVYIWGAQLEAGAFPTSYIPTDGTAGGNPRSADIASMTGTNFSSWYNFNQGTFFTKARWPYPNNAQINYPQLSLGVGLNGCLEYFIVYADYPRFSYFPPTGGEISSDPQGITSISSALNSSAFSYISSSDFTGQLVSSINGKTPVKTKVNKLTFNINAQNTLKIGKSINVGSNELNGTISRITYYPRRLTDNQLKYLTQ